MPACPVKKTKYALLLGTLLSISLLFAPPAVTSPQDLTPICTIQGSGFQSPHAGRNRTTRGVVHGDLDDTARRGFFIQDQDCDGNPATSDGLFVYLGERVDVVCPGDLVEVTGQVNEYFGLTELVVNPADVTVLSAWNPLPVPVELAPPFDNPESNGYFERLEGMRVSLWEAATVGPTDYDDRTWVVRADLGMRRVHHDDPRGTGEIICIDDDGTYEIAPEAKVPDRVTGLLGVLDYKGGDFCVQLFAPPTLLPEVDARTGTTSGVLTAPGDMFQVPQAGASIKIATFNLANLFDTIDDPGTDDTVLSASEYQRRLGKRAAAIHNVLGEPAILALQETENDAVLQALVNRPEIESDYAYIWQDGPDQRGIDVAILYRPDLVTLVESQVRQGCTTLVDGLGPDGNEDVYNPQNALTCDTDGNADLDGNRLFSRPPLVAHFNAVISSPLGDPLQEELVDLWLVDNHWKSKLQDSEVTQYTLNRRLEQAKFVSGLVDEVLTRDPSAVVVVLGDLNDHLNSQPLEILSGKVDNQFASQPRDQQYTYIYHGLSQVLDHILLRTRLPVAPLNFTPCHINADFPSIFETVDGSYYRSSDHDLLLLELGILPHHVYLTVVQR